MMALGYNMLIRCLCFHDNMKGGEFVLPLYLSCEDLMHMPKCMK